LHRGERHVLRDGPLARGVRRCALPRGPEPITTAIIIQHRMAVFGIADRFEDFKSIVRLRTSIGLEQRVPHEWAKSVA